MLESYIFRQISAKLLPKTKAALLWKLKDLTRNQRYNIHLSSLTSCNVVTMVINKTKIYFFVTLTLCACAEYMGS